MAQDIVNNNQSISYTNLDFSSIYIELLELVKKLTYRWDPSISDESDPGVILLKLSALIADKCNYNIDKSILEAFPLSVTQDANAQQLYEQLGYYMNWYESATVPVILNWTQATAKDEEVKSYTIPKFTIITDDEDKINYALIGVEGASDIVVSDGIITTDAKELRMIAMEGTPVNYTYLGQDTVITAQMVDKDTHRIYFDTPWVAQNGVFITNTKQNNYAEWKRVNNIYEQSYAELRYKFGYDNYSDSCYLEFPDNYSELFGDGIEITYMQIDEKYSDIPAQTLEKFLVGVTPVEDSSVVLNQSNVAIKNYYKATGHKNKEDINEAYENYKKTVGTFHTLITLRDYLNYIRSTELDICSNAFVCDRTNDIQSTYKIVSKQHGLDSIIVKVEQIVDETTFESNFNYRFKLSEDEDSIPNKDYYIIKNDTLTKVIDTSLKHPKALGWYEFESITPTYHDALEPFSLKFYLLNNSISLDNKQAFNETFEMSNKELDFDSLLSDVAHLEHKFEDILPLGKNTYKETEDSVFLENKAYYILKEDNIHYQLYTKYDIGESTQTQGDVIYELDIEALLPHTVFFKNIYPLSVNISTYDSLNEKTQDSIKVNVINALYNSVNSSQLEFGESINTDYLSRVIIDSDDRIKDVSFDSINYYIKAIYYDDQDKTFKEVTIPSTIKDVYLGKNTYVKAKSKVFLPDTKYFTKVDSIHYNEYTNYEVGERIPTTMIIYELEYDQKSIDKIIGNMIGKDIICKSILAGTTYLLTPDDVFTFHLNQKFINFFENIYSITSQAVIDIGGEDATTTYSSDSANPFIRQSYRLKPNETISLYRPQLENLREFSSGIHYECFLYNDIREGQSYELQKDEYIIFYQSYYADSSITSGAPEGFNVYCCTKGIIVSPSFDIIANTNKNSLSNYAKAKIIPHFEDSTDNWYETDTYSYNYVNEIYNSSSIINNAIKGTNTVKLQSVYAVEIEESDNYKFFWSLKEPTYSNDNKLKTFTLFPEYDVSTDRAKTREKNTYTLKTGEWLYYTDSSYSNLAIMGAGTTIYRNCGLVSEYDDENASSCFSFIPISAFENTADNHRFKDGILETITSYNDLLEKDVINPYANGWYEEDSEPDTYKRTEDTSVASGKTYYVLVMDDNSGLYKRVGEPGDYQYSSTLQSSDVFSEIEINDYLGNVNPTEENWYEIVTCNNSRVTDYYAINDGASYNDYLRYTKSLDESIFNRKIFTGDDYDDIDISDTSTYKSIDINQNNAASFDYVSQRLLMPAKDDDSYKKYYTDSTGTTRITGIKVVDNPSDANNNHTSSIWYEEVSEGIFEETTDIHPVLSTLGDSLEYPSTLSEDYCFIPITKNNWNTIIGGCQAKGYFYKENTSDTEYRWEPTRTNDVSQVTSEMLAYLLSLYSSTSRITNLTTSTNILDYMQDNWNTGISYNHPFKIGNKLGWKVHTFTPTIIESEITHIGMSLGTYNIYRGVLSSLQISPNYMVGYNYVEVDNPVQEDINNYYTYDGNDYIPVSPYTEVAVPTGNPSEQDYYEYDSISHDYVKSQDVVVDLNKTYYMQTQIDPLETYYIYDRSGYDVILPSTARLAIDDSSLYTTLKLNTTANSDVEIFDRVNHTDDEIKDYLDYLLLTFQTVPVNFGMWYKGKLFEFRDLYRLSSKSYFTPSIYVSKVFDPVDPWSCVALDNDNIADDPVNVIGEKQWQSLQSNTSIKIVQNEMWSFSEDDVLRFEAPSSSRKSIVWPRFSNTEIPLDLDSYSISYQRKGQSIEDLNKLVLEGYEWQGYSQLLLNTSNEDSQKLESNHSLILYGTDNSWDDPSLVHEIATINGSDYTNVSFQLKNPVSNVAGRHVDVTTTDEFRTVIPNSVYEFVPLLSSSDSGYVYNSDHTTYAIFNVETDPVQISTKYEKTSDTELVTGKQYYIYAYTYSAIGDPTGNPVVNRWYEEDDGQYTLSEDTEVQQDKTYYEQTSSLEQVLSPDVSNIANYYEEVPIYDINKIINNQVKIPLLLPKGKYILPVYTETEGVRYYVSKYIEGTAHNTEEPQSRLKYCINCSPTMSPDESLIMRVGHNEDSNGIPYGEHLYSYETEKYVGRLNNNYYINDNKYHYLDITVDGDPESEEFIKVSLPAHLSEYYKSGDEGSGSPEWFGWYEYDSSTDSYSESTDSTSTVDDLLEQVTEYTQLDNPCELHWYEYHYVGDDDNPLTSEYYYELSTDTTPIDTKTYFKDKDYYVKVKDVSSPVLKVNAENPFISIDSESINIVFEDIFKYNNNPDFNKNLFDEVKKKMRMLDDESLYNYAFRISNNDEITDPLEPKYFFENNHICNKYTIPQLDFDMLNIRFTTRNASRR